MRHGRIAALIVVLAACSAPREDRPRASASPAAAPRQQGVAAAPSDSAYLALRDSFARALDARIAAGVRTVFHSDSLALRALEQRLRPLVGPVTIRGFADSGRINLETVLSGDDDSGLADGLVYESLDHHARAFVTTRSLFQSWITARFDNAPAIARDPVAALASDRVYTAIFFDGSAVYRYVDLPVNDSSKRVVAAMLVGRAQDFCPTCAPEEILVGVDAGHRIVVFDAPARDTLDAPSCRAVAAAVSQPTDTTGRTSTVATDSVPFALRPDPEERQFADYVRCYASTVRTDPRFAAIVDQARALIGALPDR